MSILKIASGFWYAFLILPFRKDETLLTYSSKPRFAFLATKVSTTLLLSDTCDRKANENNEAIMMAMNRDKNRLRTVILIPFLANFFETRYESSDDSSASKANRIAINNRRSGRGPNGIGPVNLPTIRRMRLHGIAESPVKTIDVTHKPNIHTSLGVGSLKICINLTNAGLFVT
jgi:hypothetical protein